MQKRTIQATVYVILLLFDSKTKRFLKDVYSEANFTFTTYANAQASPEELVTARMIQTRLTAFFAQQEALPKLKSQYPTLPDFYIGSGKLFSQEVFFAEVAHPKQVTK
jgi:hypothetical protein